MSGIKRTDQEIGSIMTKAALVQPEDPQYPVAYTVLTVILWLLGKVRTEALWLLLNGVNDPKDGRWN